MNRLEATFQRLKAKGKKALIPYLMAGDPSLQDTETLVLELERAGADIIELGIPFSDPIADGPVIQKAAERALRGGTSLLVSSTPSPACARARRSRWSSWPTTTPFMRWVNVRSVHRP